MFGYMIISEKEYDHMVYDKADLERELLKARVREHELEMKIKDMQHWKKQKRVNGRFAK